MEEIIFILFPSHPQDNVLLPQDNYLIIMMYYTLLHQDTCAILFPKDKYFIPWDILYHSLVNFTIECNHGLPAHFDEIDWHKLPATMHQKSTEYI